MVREVQEPVQLERDEEDGDGTIETYFNRIKKCHWNSNGFSFSFFMESEEVQRSKVACLFAWSKLELKTILVETFKCTL